ncbi:MAG: DeoR/GlpR family DNA-binding transcription regulator [Lentilitoribacter sp.]
MNLNIPDTRQQALAKRLDQGSQLIAQELAEEFDVSLDTIRRDILALEANGKARRVRGGAVPIAKPVSPMLERLASDHGVNQAIIDATLAHIAHTPTLLVDGGTTTLAIISQLPKLDQRLVITPSPWIAIAAQERGCDVHLLGGNLSSSGGIATGNTALADIKNLAVDIALLGVCGLDADFGLSADDYAEMHMKQAMHRATERTIVATDHLKLNTRARHHTLPVNEIDLIITDASSEQVQTFEHTDTAFELV